MAVRFPPYQHSLGRGAGLALPRSSSYRSTLPVGWRPPGLPVWNPGSNAAIRSRVAGAASMLPPLNAPFSSADTAGGAAPPGYGDLLNQLLAGLGGAQGGISPEEGLAQARRALIQYGGVPQGLSGLHNLGNAFDSGTSALANANTSSGISLLARINQAHTDQQRYITNRLAAHGILQSGETGFQQGREQTNYARAQADSAGKLLDYLSGINSGISSYMQWQAMMDAIRNAQAGGTPTGEPGPGPGGYTGPGYGGAIPTSQSTTWQAIQQGAASPWVQPNNAHRRYAGGGRYYAF